MPRAPKQLNKQAFLLTGLPASGKSTIATKFADNFGAVILDSDFAKRKLPEYSDSPAGAALVHEESDVIIFGDDSNPSFSPLIQKCYNDGTNIVIPKIGHNYKSLETFAMNLSILGYEVHLTLVSLDRRIATVRAIDRYLRTDRYVPLSLIFDGYSNEPVLSYYRLKNNTYSNSDVFKSFGKISTDVEMGQKPRVIFTDKENPATLFV